MSTISLNIQLDHTFSHFAQWIAKQTAQEPVFVLMDENTNRLCLPLIQNIFHHNTQYIVVKPGEEYKTLETVENIIQQLIQQKAGKKSILISLGGGVICDIGAFVASIYKRGIRSVLIPTTLLAQLDASIGGKTGVDFLGNKNMIGTFSWPEQVFISSKFLDTLPHHEKMNGAAEALKHALIADTDYWESIKENPLKNITSLISTSVSIKKNVVEKDPYEKGLRKILNAGHTIGHAVESTFLNNGSPIGHGEAVVSGLIIELFISNKLDLISIEQMNEGVSYLRKHYTKLPLERFQIEEYMGYMYQDKKNTGKKISFSLITQIGGANWDQYIDEPIIRKGFNFYINS